MTERGDLSVEWNRRPRIITVAAPSTVLCMQDIVDTLKGILEQSWNGMDEPALHSSGGKQVLDDTTNVGITITLLDAEIAFAARNQSISQGTATSDDATGKVLNDTGATFQSDGVAEGDTVINFSDLSLATVISVPSEIQIITYALEDGTLNEWTTGDVYKIFHVAQCELDGGNIVAVDDVDIEVGVPMSPISPTAFTQIVKTSSSSATLSDQSGLIAKIAGVHITAVETTSTIEIGAWLDDGHGRRTDLDGMTAQLVLRDGTVIEDLGSGSGGGAGENGAFSWSASSGALASGTAFVLTIVATKGAETWYGNRGISKVG